jgi:hypothetical protein
MRAWGYLASKPIHVVREGSKLRVIDGHHRMEAARLAKVAVIYQIGEAKEADAMVDINRNTKSWTTRNYVDAYAMKGNQHYITLLAYVKKGVPMNVAASLLYGHAASSNNTREIIPYGQFEVRDTSVIEALVGFLQNAPAECKELRTTSYIAAVTSMMAVPEFDLDVLLKKITNNPRAIVKVACRDQALEVIEEIYNHRSFSKTNFAFLAKQILDSRSAVHKIKPTAA